MLGETNMATFKEWQAANLTEQQQEECNQLGVEYQDKLIASNANISVNPPTWSTDDERCTFYNNVNPKFNEYWKRYELANT
jgi:hypothetical protein